MHEILGAQNDNLRDRLSPQAAKLCAEAIMSFGGDAGKTALFEKEIEAALRRRKFSSLREDFKKDFTDRLKRIFGLPDNLSKDLTIEIFSPMKVEVPPAQQTDESDRSEKIAAQ